MYLHDGKLLYALDVVLWCDSLFAREGVQGRDHAPIASDGRAGG